MSADFGPRLCVMLIKVILICGLLEISSLSFLTWEKSYLYIGAGIYLFFFFEGDEIAWKSRLEVESWMLQLGSFLRRIVRLSRRSSPSLRGKFRNILASM